MMGLFNETLRKEVVGPRTTNNLLVSRAIKRSIGIQRYTNAEVHKIVALMNDDVVPDLVAEYQKRLDKIKVRGYDTSLETSKRLRDMIQSTDAMARGLIDGVQEELKKDMQSLAVTEAEWQAAVITDVMPVNFDVLLPSPTLLKSIIEERPFDGHLMKDWFGKLADDLQNNVIKEVQIGLARGDSTQQLVARIAGTREERGVLDITRRNAEAITRTAANHVTTQAREVTYDENDDLVDSVQMVATLDDRTTEICMAEDGNVYPINEGPRPPFHYNCRTASVPVLKSWDELGIPAKEADASTRASMNGQVSDKLTYGDWLKEQTPEIQNSALGPARAELFRSGKVDIKQFVNDKGKLLTLDQLKEQFGV